MNSTLPLPDIARLLELQGGIDYDVALKLVRDFFEVIAEGLASGEVVKVRGLGVFKASADPDKVVDFLPAEELNAAINAPFEAFTPIELPADLTASEVEKLVETSHIDAQDESVTEDASRDNEAADNHDDKLYESEYTENIPCGESLTETEEEIVDVEEDNSPVKTCSDDVTVSTKQEDRPIHNNPPDAIDDKADVDETDEDTVYILPRTHKHSCKSTVMWSGISLLAGIAIGGICAYVGHDKLVKIFEGSQEHSQPVATDRVDNSQTSEKVPPDILLQEQQQLEDISAKQTEDSVAIDNTSASTPVYDTISSRCFLTTMAGRHYGEKEFWVYIYNANAHRLKHPDRIKPGTRILIPDISTLPLTGDHKADVITAKRLGQQIYSRYQ